DAIGPVPQDVLGRGRRRHDRDPAAVRREHPQDVPLGPVIDRDDMKERRLLTSIPRFALPYRLGPRIALQAGDLAGEVHPFEPRPGRRLVAQPGDVEPAVTWIGDDPARRALVANQPGQPPGIDPREPDDVV